MKKTCNGCGMNEKKPGAERDIFITAAISALAGVAVGYLLRI